MSESKWIASPPTNDIENAQLFSETFRHELRYVTPWKSWIGFDGKRWKIIDARTYVHQLMKDTLPLLATGITDDAKRGYFLKHASKSCNTWSISNVLKEAGCMMAIEPGELDADPWLFNLQNGTLNCKTATIQPHQPADFITKISPCKYDENAICPEWDKFLAAILPEDFAAFLQAGMGYSLTGSVREECMFILYGDGANGKSTFIETMLHCLGDYAQTMSPAVLLSDRTQGVNSDDIARLCGVRFAASVETKKGGAMNCEKVKAITGGDRITACRKYGSPFDFDPTHKIWLATNHRPKIDTDHGMVRRLRLIPFTTQIPEDTRDVSLKGKDGKLIAESSGILNWIIAGLKRWQSQGLKIPEDVKAATQEWTASNDTIAEFLADKCFIAANAQVSSSDLHHSYKLWCMSNNEKPVEPRDFKVEMQKKGYLAKRNNAGVFFQGVALAKSVIPMETLLQENKI